MTMINVENLKYDYDKESDVLYAFIGSPRPAVSEEVSEGIAVRRDPNDNSLVGFIIDDYMKRLTLQMLSEIPLFKDLSLPSFE
jgi:hypothetical protein